ncbi:hypothetical protein [Ostreiculturibacter nitratireducens]|uniref:hypothetical protein n=1 Tax=Ostreiculturibacter nitratireducens TaxID=3075226 RepID=UPI0031B5C61F
MAKPESDTNPVAEMVRQAQEFLAANPMIGPQVRQFWDAQENILNEAEQYAHHWFERRHEATQTALEAAKRMTSVSASDPAHAMTALAEWQTHSLERLAEDVQEWVTMCSRCAGYLTASELEAGKEAVEETARKAGLSGKAKHATPV